MIKIARSVFVIIIILCCSFSFKAQTVSDSSLSNANKSAFHKNDTGKSKFRGKQQATPYRIIGTDTIRHEKYRKPIKRQAVSPKKEKNNTDTIKQSREQIKMRKDTVNSNPYKETNPVK